MITTIIQFYLQNLLGLPLNTQFHFLSRMYLWTKEVKYKLLVLDLKYSYIGDTKKASTQKIAQCLTSYQPLYIRYFDKRKKYLEAFLR